MTFWMRRARALSLGLVLGLLAFGASGSTSPMSTPINLDSNTTACQGVQIAAASPANVVVAWTTADPGRGICYRQRLNYVVWEPVKHLGGNVGAQPRDLVMAFDKIGRLNMVWTALEGSARRIYYARLDGQGGAPQAGPLIRNAAVPGAEAGDVDFPALNPDPAGGVVIAWQESRQMRFSIRAVHILAGGELDDLGSVSGSSLSGLSPQVIASYPAIQVAWYEITESGSELRVNEWQSLERRWRPAAAEREAQQFPHNVQLLLTRADLGLMAAWPEVLGDGRGAIKLGLKTMPVAGGGVSAPVTEVLAEPVGQHTRPTFSGTLPGRLTLAWQVLTPGSQAIRLASIQTGLKMPIVVDVSQPEQRFAAMPDHVTVGHWSAVVWTDDVHEGGHGGIYFSQFNWPVLQ